MRRMLAILSVTVLGGWSACAQEQAVKMKDLPPAVQKTVQEQTKGAVLKGLSKEVENGKTTYELETTVKGRSRDLLIDASGVVVEVEEEVALDSIPPAAKAAIAKNAAGGKITRVETVTRGKTTTYEAAITKAGKSSEVAVAADGTIQK